MTFLLLMNLHFISLVAFKLHFKSEIVSGSSCWWQQLLALNLISTELSLKQVQYEEHWDARHLPCGVPQGSVFGDSAAREQVRTLRFDWSELGR